MMVMTDDLNKKVTKREVLIPPHLSQCGATLKNVVLQHEPNIGAINNSFGLSTGSGSC